MMNLSTDDPRLTAYALGELDDPGERAAIEQALATRPELQAAVDEIRRTAELLQSGLAGEPAPEPSEFEKARMEQVPEPPSVGDRLSETWAVHKRAIIALAATVAFAAIIIPQMRIFKEQSAPISVSQGDVQSETPEGHMENIDASLKAVEGLDIRAAQQADRVEEILERLEALPKPGETAAASVPEQSERESEAITYDEFVRRHPVDRDTEAVRKRERGDAPAITAPALSSTRKVEIPPPASPPRQGSPSGSDLSMGGSLGLVEGSRTRTQMLTEVDSAWERPKVFTDQPKRGPSGDWNTESYDPIEDTDFRSPQVAPLSTFSIDVDTAAYANVRRFLQQGQLPPADAVRIEELINYFPYEDAPPTESLDEGGDPFAVHLAQTSAPWNEAHRLLRIGIQGYEMPWEARPASNLVFLLDVSGSMNRPNKLPLVKEAMDLLLRRLDRRDRVAIVVYAGASGLVLPSTSADNAETIRHALDQLSAGGSTNAGAGIELAYRIAREHFIEDGNNRVILCTDGDFNVGLTNRGTLADVAEKQAEEGVSLTVLGFGMGNLKDDMLETLSNKGKGSYAYVDSEAEARKVFLEELASNLFKIAKDVKIQVEFNPALVHAYRLIGYENRRLQAEDFNDDRKKAGDIGPGHSVVALYEIVPVGVELALPGVDDLRYQGRPEAESPEGEVATVKLRYKRPEAEESQLLTRTVRNDELIAFERADADLRFAAAVAAFGMRLRESPHVSELDYREIERIAANALGRDPGGHRSEFTKLVRKAERIAQGASGAAGERE